jgi:hypothetical protein
MKGIVKVVIEVDSMINEGSTVLFKLKTLIEFETSFNILM